MSRSGSVSLLGDRGDGAVANANAQAGTGHDFGDGAEHVEVAFVVEVLHDRIPAGEGRGRAERSQPGAGAREFRLVRGEQAEYGAASAFAMDVDVVLAALDRAERIGQRWAAADLVEQPDLGVDPAVQGAARPIAHLPDACGLLG